MSKYYALYPGPKGLEVSSLGNHDDFDGACEADAANEKTQDREPSIWIANEQDLRNLYASVKSNLLKTTGIA